MPRVARGPCPGARAPGAVTARHVFTRLRGWFAGFCMCDWAPRVEGSQPVSDLPEGDLGGIAPQPSYLTTWRSWPLASVEMDTIVPSYHLSSSGWPLMPCQNTLMRVPIGASITIRKDQDIPPLPCDWAPRVEGSQPVRTCLRGTSEA